jgi:hypothetical protein
MNTQLELFFDSQKYWNTPNTSNVCRFTNKFTRAVKYIDVAAQHVIIIAIA